MLLGKKKIVIKKLDSSILESGIIETGDFDINEFTKPYLDQYWFVNDESSVQVNGDVINLILVFKKKDENKGERRNIEDILPTYKINV